MRAVNHSYHSGELSLVQRQDIVTLIPNENKLRRFVLILSKLIIGQFVS